MLFIEARAHVIQATVLSPELAAFFFHNFKGIVVVTIHSLLFHLVLSKHVLSYHVCHLACDILAAMFPIST